MGARSRPPKDKQINLRNASNPLALMDLRLSLPPREVRGTGGAAPSQLRVAT